jgi:hypothetical protein
MISDSSFFLLLLFCCCLPVDRACTYLQLVNMWQYRYGYNGTSCIPLDRLLSIVLV